VQSVRPWAAYKLHLLSHVLDAAAAMNLVKGLLLQCATLFACWMACFAAGE
jgi:hypothetical protein